MARTENAVAPATSIVDTTELPRPAVVVDEVTRAKPVIAWIVAAVPPPAMIASDQRRKGLTPTTEDAITMIPATTAAGLAIRSRR